MCVAAVGNGEFQGCRSSAREAGQGRETVGDLELGAKDAVRDSIAEPPRGLRMQGREAPRLLAPTPASELPGVLFLSHVPWLGGAAPHWDNMEVARWGLHGRGRMPLNEHVCDKLLLWSLAHRKNSINSVPLRGH